MLQIYEVSLGLHAAERGSLRLTALAPGSDGLGASWRLEAIAKFKITA